MPAQDDAVALAVQACEAAAERKASDPLILEVADLLGLVDCFVVVSGGNDRQLKAIAEVVEHQLRETHERRPLRREGTPSSGWVLLDYGDVVCHLFVAERRDHYALERLWGDVPRRDVETGERLPPLTARARDGA